MRRWGRSIAASLVAMLLVAGGAVQGGRPAPVLAATSGAFLLDTLTSGSIHTVRLYRDPLDSQVSVQWNAAELTVFARPTTGAFVQYSLGSGTGAALGVGTFPMANIDGCTGSLSIASLAPAVEIGAPAALTELSASFSRTCGTESTYGEIRLNSDDPYAVLGTATLPIDPAAIGMVGAGAAFVGKDTDTSSVTLENFGTVPLEMGSATFDPAPVPTWTLTTNTCTGTLAPGATCTIAGHAKAWVPNWYQDVVTLRVSTVRGSVRVQASSMFAAARFVAIDPVRLVDTRTGLGIASSLRTRVARTFTVVDRQPSNAAVNIPPEAVAVTGNLTIVGPTSAGWAAVTTTPANSPSIRTLYTTTGETRNNAVVLRLSDGGTLGLTWIGAAGSSAHAVFDATGYFVPIEVISGLRSGNYRPYAPLRIVDTKAGKGISGHLVAGKPRTFMVPLEGVYWENTAVTGVVTVVKPAQGGSISIGPAPVASPATTTLSFKAGESRSNTFFGKLSAPSDYGTPKTLSITYVGKAGTSVDVLVDIHGMLGEAGGFGYVPLVPNRIVDSNARKVLSRPLPSNRLRELNIANRVPADPSRNLPPDNFTDAFLYKQGITGNLWMVRPTATGVLTAVPPGPFVTPKVSTIRAPAGSRRACTLVLGTAGAGTGLGLWYAARTGSSTDVEFDVTGYFVY